MGGEQEEEWALLPFSPPPPPLHLPFLFSRGGAESRTKIEQAESCLLSGKKGEDKKLVREKKEGKR